VTAAAEEAARRSTVAVPLAEHGGPLSFMTTAQADRFWSKVDKSGECWLWTAAIDGNGYGKFQITTGWHLKSGRPTQVHVRAPRLSLALATGQWPTLFVLHACDTPLCVNPAHLREGTQKENIADVSARGRMGRRGKNPNPVRGERHWKAKLTSAQVAEMRSRRGRGETLQKIAAAFGISESHVSRVCLGLSRRVA
jgi:hypothetical protein